MKEIKLCPLRKINGKTFDHCYKERCAWYDNIAEECVIKEICEELFRIKLRLSKMVERADP